MRHSWNRVHSAAAAGLAILGIGCSDSMVGTGRAPDPAIPTVEALTPRELSGRVDQAVEPTPRIAVKDRDGRPMPGIRVLFSTVGGGSLLPRDGYVITDNRGIAELGEWQLPSRTGTCELVVVIAGRALMKFTAQGLPGSPAAITGSRLPDAALPGMTLKYSVTITDKFGNTLAALPVTFSVIAGSGSLSRTQATTNAQGLAETDWTLHSSGENTVSASSADLATRFSIAVHDAAESEFTFYDLLSIKDNFHSQLILRSWIALDAAGHFLNFMEYRSGQQLVFAGDYQLTPHGQTLFDLVLGGHLDCEEYGALDGDYLYFDRHPFLDCDDEEWSTARWTYQRRGSPALPFGETTRAR